MSETPKCTAADVIPDLAEFVMDDDIRPDETMRFELDPAMARALLEELCEHGWCYECGQKGCDCGRFEREG